MDTAPPRDRRLLDGRPSPPEDGPSPSRSALDAAFAAFALDELDDAASHAAHAVEVAKTAVERGSALWFEAEVAIQRSYTGVARRAAALLREIRPDLPSWATLRARAAFREERFEEALQYFDVEAELAAGWSDDSPHVASPERLLAARCAGRGEVVAAMASMLDGPLDERLQGRLQRVRLLADTGRRRDAEQVLDDVLTHGPADWPGIELATAIRWIAELAQELGREPAALALYEQGARDAPGFRHGMLLRHSGLLRALGDAQGALRSAELAVEAGPNDPSVVAHLAQLLTATGRHEEGVRLEEELTARSSPRVRRIIRPGLALTYLRMGLVGRAVEQSHALLDENQEPWAYTFAAAIPFEQRDEPGDREWAARIYDMWWTHASLNPMTLPGEFLWKAATEYIGLLWRSGEHSKAARIADELREMPYWSPAQRAQLHQQETEAVAAHLSALVGDLGWTGSRLAELAAAVVGGGTALPSGRLLGAPRVDAAGVGPCRQLATVLSDHTAPAEGHASPVVRLGVATREALVLGCRVALSPRAFAVLLRLGKRAGAVVCRDELMNAADAADRARESSREGDDIQKLVTCIRAAIRRALEPDPDAAATLRAVVRRCPDEYTDLHRLDEMDVRQLLLEFIKAHTRVGYRLGVLPQDFVTE